MPWMDVGNNYSVNMLSGTWLQNFYTSNLTSVVGFGQYSNRFDIYFANGADLYLWGRFSYPAGNPTSLPYADSVITGYELYNGSGGLVVELGDMPAVRVDTFISWFNAGYAYAGGAIQSLLGSRRLEIWGGSSNDVLAGQSGNDYFNGEGGFDAFYGGLGSDDYIVDGGDTIVEYAGQGTDDVFAYAAFTLPDNVENLFLQDSGGGIDGFGNAGKNLIVGNASVNVLKGFDGNDTLDGKKAGDKLDGGGGKDLLLDNAGNDELDGGSGDDTMQGGAGNDTYFVDSASDRVKEGARAGTDMVKSKATRYTLPAEVEHLVLLGGGNIDGSGNGGINRITGNDGDNYLNGGAGNDTMFGEGGDDTFNGGNGNDSAVGGRGDDVYLLGSASDKVKELSDQGFDTVQAAFTYTLSENVEVLKLTGSGLRGIGNDIDNWISANAEDNTLKGGGGNDSLSGGSGKDTLDGGGGNDTLNGGTSADSMAGGLGDDVYFLDTGDRIKELIDGGIDTVIASISYALGSTSNLDNLTLTGTASNGTGNGLDNTITGNSRNNVLDGKAGVDTLLGMGGNDTLVWDAVDAVADGGTGEDKLRANVAVLDLRAAVDAGQVLNLEVIDNTGGTGANNSVYLTFQDVLDLSDTDVLRIDGNAGDVLHRETGWVDEIDDLAGYYKYSQGGAILQVGVNVAIVEDL